MLESLSRPDRLPSHSRNFFLMNAELSTSPTRSLGIEAQYRCAGVCRLKKAIRFNAIAPTHLSSRGNVIMHASPDQQSSQYFSVGLFGR
jgi:hypothetical protein